VEQQTYQLLKLSKNTTRFLIRLLCQLQNIKKGFSHTLFIRRQLLTIVKYDIRFKINYLKHTVTVEDDGKLNERIKIIKSKIARPAVHVYTYMQINSESYFDEIDSTTINLRFIEKIKGMDRKIIISVDEQCLKFTL
jgi:hypothetical protein